MQKNKNMKFSSQGIEKELNRVRYKERYGKTLRSTIYALITVAAIAVLVATLALPVLQIYGSSTFSPFIYKFPSLSSSTHSPAVAITLFTRILLL